MQNNAITLGNSSSTSTSFSAEVVLHDFLEPDIEQEEEEVEASSIGNWEARKTPFSPDAGDVEIGQQFLHLENFPVEDDDNKSFSSVTPITYPSHFHYLNVTIQKKQYSFVLPQHQQIHSQIKEEEEEEEALAANNQQEQADDQYAENNDNFINNNNNNNQSAHSNDNGEKVLLIDTSIYTTSDHVATRNVTVRVRCARKLEWQEINELQEWYSLPFKFLFRIIIPFALISINETLEILFTRHSDAMAIQSAIHTQLKSTFHEKEARVYETLVYFTTTSFLHKKSKFKIVLVNKERRIKLFESEPRMVYARKNRTQRKKKKKKQQANSSEEEDDEEEGNDEEEDEEYEENNNNSNGATVRKQPRKKRRREKHQK